MFYDYFVIYLYSKCLLADPKAQKKDYLWSKTAKLR